MPRWLMWFIVVFATVNGLALIANVPNPFTLIFDFISDPPSSGRTLDAGIQALGMFVALVMLLCWGVFALILRSVIRKPVRTAKPMVRDRAA